MNQLPILLVDDDIVDRRSLERWCLKNQIQFQIASNGLEALNLIKHNSYAMVLSDIDMPVMDGLKLSQELKKLEGTTHKHIPVIAISGNEQLGLNNQFSLLGFDYFLPKPAPSEMLNRVFQMYK